MATRGMFGVSNGKDLHTKVIGLIPDGFVKNLQYAADLFEKAAGKLRLKSKVKTFDSDAINAVMEETIKAEPKWFFVDELKNVPSDGWCEYAVVLNIKNGSRAIYHGKPSKYNEAMFLIVKGK